MYPGIHSLHVAVICGVLQTHYDAFNSSGILKLANKLLTTPIITLTIVS